MSFRGSAFMTLLLLPSTPAQAIVYDTQSSKVHLEALEDHYLCVKRDRSGDFCRAALYEWVEQHPEDAFKAGKLARQTLNGRAALPLFRQAFKARKGSCKDADVALAIGAAAEKPLSKELAKDFHTLAFDTCFEQVKGVLVKAATSETGRKNVCGGLLARNALNGVRKKKCERLAREGDPG